MLACPGQDPGSIWDLQIRQPPPVVTLALHQSAGKVVKPAHVYLSAQQIKVSLTSLYCGTIFSKKDKKLAMLSQGRDLVSSFWPVQSGNPWKQKTQSRQGISYSLLCSHLSSLGLWVGLEHPQLFPQGCACPFWLVACILPELGLNWEVALHCLLHHISLLTSLQWAPVSLVRTLNLF